MSNNKEDLLPEGTYQAVAVKKKDEAGQEAYARWTLSNGDKPLALVFLSIVDHPDVYPIVWRGSFSDSTMGSGKNKKTVARRTVESLRYMGFKGTDFETLETQVLDQIVSVVVEHDEGEDGDGNKTGKWYLRIAWVNELGGGAIKLKPMSTEQIRKFSAMMSKNLAQIPDVDGARMEGNSGTGGGSQSDPNDPFGDGGGEQPPSPDDSDIPFVANAELCMGVNSYHQPLGRAV